MFCRQTNFDSATLSSMLLFTFSTSGIAIKKVGPDRGLGGWKSIGAALFSGTRALHKLIVTADLNKVSFFTNSRIGIAQNICSRRISV
jgi:hypothetical protein